MKSNLLLALIPAILLISRVDAQIGTVQKPQSISAAMLLYPEIFEIYLVESQENNERSHLDHDIQDLGLVKLNYEGADFLVRVYADQSDFFRNKVNLKPLLEENNKSLKLEKLGTFGWEYLPHQWRYLILNTR